MADRNRTLGLSARAERSAASRPMAMKARDRLARRASALWRDTNGLMAPYVAVMLPVLVGFALLALDASRRMSLQTQMQAAADSLALAGARELNKEAGAEVARNLRDGERLWIDEIGRTRFSALGRRRRLPTPTPSIPACRPRARGSAAQRRLGNSDAKYVAVKVTPQTWSTILPATFLANVRTNAFAVGAEAVAGFAGTSVCSVAPIFVCNPYEASSGSMTDAQATAALHAAFDNPAILRRQLKLNRNGVGPGHFGWLNTADGCKDPACMATNIAGVSGACYSDAGVSLAIGDTNAVEQYFDARFDIYNQDPPLSASSADPPAVNVRKGYLPGRKAKAVDWCTAAPASASSRYYTYPSDRTVGTVTGNSATVTDVASTTGVTTGEPIVDAAGAIASTSDNPATVVRFRRFDDHALRPRPARPKLQTT